MFCDIIAKIFVEIFKKATTTSKYLKILVTIYLVFFFLFFCQKEMNVEG